MNKGIWVDDHEARRVTIVFDDHSIIEYKEQLSENVKITIENNETLKEKIDCELISIETNTSDKDFLFIDYIDSNHIRNRLSINTRFVKMFNVEYRP